MALIEYPPASILHLPVLVVVPNGQGIGNETVILVNQY